MSETDTDAPSPSEATPATTEATGPPGAAQLKQDVIAAIKTCYDPEIPIDIYELGLIYEIEVREANAVFIKMTLTSPMCPVAETLPPTGSSAATSGSATAAVRAARLRRGERWERGWIGCTW